MLRTAQRDRRDRAPRQISIALLTILLCGGCSLRRPEDPADAAATTAPAAKPEIYVGRVSVVDGAGRFVLVEAPYGVAPGSELQLRRGTAPVGRLRAGSERRAGIFAAGIESGVPEVGDNVVLVSR